MRKLIRSKKGQRIFVYMMVSILAFIVLLIIVSPLRTELSKASNGTFSSHLNSSDSSISIPNQATVVVLDMTLFYFVVILIGASLAFVSGRRTFTHIATAIMTFVVVSVLISPLKSLIVIARDSTHLDCAAITTTGQSLACIFTGLWLFYFVSICIFVAVGYIFIKTTSKSG